MDKDEIISKLGWFTQMKSIPPLTDKFKTEQIIFFENIIQGSQADRIHGKAAGGQGEHCGTNREKRKDSAVHSHTSAL